MTVLLLLFLPPPWGLDWGGIARLCHRGHPSRGRLAAAVSVAAPPPLPPQAWTGRPTSAGQPQKQKRRRRQQRCRKTRRQHPPASVPTPPPRPCPRPRINDGPRAASPPTIAPPLRLPTWAYFGPSEERRTCTVVFPPPPPTAVPPSPPPPSPPAPHSPRRGCQSTSMASSRVTVPALRQHWSTDKIRIVDALQWLARTHVGHSPGSGWG